MGNNDHRKHYRVDELGISEEVNQMLADGCKYEEIEKHFADKGISVSKSAVGRYNNSLQRKIERIRSSHDAATAIAKSFSEQTDEFDMDMSSLMLDLLQQTVIEKSTEDKISVRDATALSMAASQLAKSKAVVEKTRLSERKKNKAMWEKIVKESRQLLEGASVWPQVERILLQGMEESEQ